MKTPFLLKTTLLAVLTVPFLFPIQLSAQAARRGGAFGDWRVKSEFNGRQVESILSLSRDADGNRTGQWISFYGLSELKNVAFDAGQLTFERVSRGQDGQSVTSKFAGKIEDGKLTGTVSSERGEYAVTGEPMPRIPQAVGNWALKLKMGEREFASTLILGADPEGALTARWESQRGEHTVTDVQFRQRQLTFKRKTKMQDQEWESTFEGTLQGNTLTGTVKSERGEGTVTGERQGGALIGTWTLDIASERGNRQQRLRVHGDLSGLFGAIPVKQISLENDRVSFPMAMQFGDQTFEMTFAGKLEEGKLVGELTSSRGSQKVTGTKAIRAAGRGGNR